MYCLSLRILFYYIFQRIETNWRTGRHTLQRIHCRSETSKGVYCLQYDETRIISGLRDNTIKVWKSKMVRTRIKFTSLFMIFQNEWGLFFFKLYLNFWYFKVNCVRNILCANIFFFKEWYCTLLCALVGNVYTVILNDEFLRILIRRCGIVTHWSVFKF